MILNRLKDQYIRFRKDEDGGITAWTLMIFLLMVVATGMPIDLMRHEIARADVQNALDRAVLAAASRTQTEDRELVFEEYMATSNFHELDDITVDYFSSEDTTFKSHVSAQAHYDVPTWFMKLIGVNSLNAAAASSALEGIGEVEIVLVLDVSLSMTMGGGSRLADLKDAAHTFVNTVLDDADDANRAEFTSISIVPFSSNVGMQRLMAGAYYPSTGGTDSMCFDFLHTDYGSIGVSTAADYTRYDEVQGSFEKCPDYNSGNIILPYTNDKDRLNDYIDGLSGVYATSQQVGMKWGLAMIDPSFRDVMQHLTTEVTENTQPVNGEYPASEYWGTGSTQIRGLPVDEDGNLDAARANSIPRDYGHNGVQKIVVLMSDGHNRGGDTLAQTPLYNQQLEYQCDLLHGREFDATTFMDSYLPDAYGDPRDNLNSITPLVSNGNATLTGVTVYTVSLFPPQSELVQDNLIPEEIQAKVENTTERQCNWERDRWGRWRQVCRDVEVPANYVFEAGFGSPDYDFVNWQDKPSNPVANFTADDNQTIYNRIRPFYDDMVARLSDDAEEGCASDGLALVAESSDDFEDIFSEISAAITRLRLVN